MQRSQIKQKVRVWSRERFSAERSKETEWLMLKNPRLPNDSGGKFLIDNIWGEGCRVCGFLLISCWWGNREVLQESTQAWICHPILHLELGAGGLVLQRNKKILFHIFLEPEPGPCPKAALLFLDHSSLVSTSPFFLDQQLFESILWNSGKVRRLNEVYFQQTRNRRHRKNLYLGAPQVPALQGTWKLTLQGYLRINFRSINDNLPLPCRRVQWGMES